MEPALSSSFKVAEYGFVAKMSQEWDVYEDRKVPETLSQASEAFSKVWGGLLEDIAWTIEFCKGSPEKQLLKGAGARADKKGPKRTKRRRRGKRGGNSAGNLISSVEKVSAEDCLYFLSPPQ